MQYFESIREAVSERKKEVLANINHHQTMNMFALNKQRGLVATALFVSKTVSAFLEAEQPTGNFLRMSAWLEEATEQQPIGLEQMPGPPQSQIFSFIPDEDWEVRSILKTVGRISDVTLDAETSSLVCPSTSEINTEMVIQVFAKNMEGETITAEEAKKSQLLVEVIASNNDVNLLHMKPSGSSNSYLVALYQPMTGGQYNVSATVHGKRLKGSPAEVKVRHGLRAFDLAQCHQSPVPSNHTLTASRQPVYWVLEDNI